GVRARAAAGDDPGALADPLVGGVDRAGDLVVRDDPLAADATEAEDPRGGRAGALGQGRAGHAVASSVRVEWRRARSRAASRSAGLDSATVSTPGSARRA